MVETLVISDDDCYKTLTDIHLNVQVFLNPISWYYSSHKYLPHSSPPVVYFAAAYSSLSQQQVCFFVTSTFWIILTQAILLVTIKSIALWAIFVIHHAAMILFNNTTIFILWSVVTRIASSCSNGEAGSVMWSTVTFLRIRTTSFDVAAGTPGKEISIYHH